jgi:hypothetical protein
MLHAFESVRCSYDRFRPVTTKRFRRVHAIPAKGSSCIPAVPVEGSSRIPFTIARYFGFFAIRSAIPIAAAKIIIKKGDQSIGNKRALAAARNACDTGQYAQRKRNRHILQIIRFCMPDRKAGCLFIQCYFLF